MTHRPALTQRETDVLALMAAGYSNRAIAEELGMAQAGVEKHSRSIFRKLGARDLHGRNPRVTAVLHFHGIAPAAGGPRQPAPG